MASSYGQTTQFLQKTAQSALTQASNCASRIYSLPGSVSLRNPHFSAEIKKPDIGRPPVLSDLFDSADKTNPTTMFIDEQAEKWVEKYFPSINGNFNNVPEDYLVGVISGVKPFGTDKSVFDLVWASARDRAYKAGDSGLKTLEANLSSRGFSMLSWQGIGAIRQLEESAIDSIGAVNIEQAVKDADIKAAILQSAVQLATQLKLGIMSALSDFYRTWLTIPDKDIERARIKAQAVASLYSALSSYYNVEVSIEELSLKAKQAAASVDLDVDKTNASRLSVSGSIASALGSAANAFADVAASASQAGGSLVAQIENI